MNWTRSSSTLRIRYAPEVVFHPWETMQCTTKAGDATPATSEIPLCAHQSSYHPFSGSSEPSPIKSLESFARDYSYPQSFYPSMTLAIEGESRDEHLTRETILYNFAPSSYWQEYVKTYWHLRTMQAIHKLSKEAIYYKNLDCDGPYDLSLPKKDSSTMSSPTATKPDLQLSANDEEEAKENYPPTAIGKRRHRRTVFSQKQLRELTRAFRVSNYISGSKRHRLAQQLGVSADVVSTWFQNQRTKLKRLLSK